MIENVFELNYFFRELINFSDIKSSRYTHIRVIFDFTYNKAKDLDFLITYYLKIILYSTIL